MNVAHLFVTHGHQAIRCRLVVRSLKALLIYRRSYIVRLLSPVRGEDLLLLLSLPTELLDRGSYTPVVLPRHVPPSRRISLVKGLLLDQWLSPVECEWPSSNALLLSARKALSKRTNVPWQRSELEDLSRYGQFGNRAIRLSGGNPELASFSFFILHATPLTLSFKDMLRGCALFAGSNSLGSVPR